MGSRNNAVNMRSTNARPVRRMVKDIIYSTIEHKVGAVAVAETVVTTAGSVKLITQSIAQGDDVNGRTGDMITIDDMHLIINVRNTETAATNIFSTRFILFADNLNVGPPPAVADVLNGATITSGYAPISRNKNRFKIYDDFIVDSVSNTNSATVSKVLKYKINRKCYYSLASGANSNGKGSLFLLEITNFASANNLFSYGWEIKYSDA